MADWAALRRELDAWAEAGMVATLWWRDDDAERPGAALDRLLGLAQSSRTPIALAVVPAGAGAPLADRLEGVEGVDVLQHGWKHQNHEPPPAKKCELGAARPRSAALADLERGARRLGAVFGPTTVLVPPWNRIREDLLEALPAIGISGLSRFGPRSTASPAAGLSQTNTHVDIIDWRARRFAGAAPPLHALVSHLAGRRRGAVDAAEPTGVLSHHGIHDEQCWRFLSELLRLTREHPAARWTAPWHETR